MSEESEKRNEDILRAFGRDYVPPSQEIDEWADWAGTIEFKLNRNGQIALAALAGVGVLGLLVGLQGKVTINLVKTQAQIVGVINSLVDGSGGDDSARTTSRTRYSTPEKTVDPSKVPPVDLAELSELERLMDASTKGELPEFGA